MADCYNTYHRRKLSPEERFSDGYCVAETGCWEWQRSGRGSGYGQFHLNGKPTPAHRAAWLLFKGPIPAGLFVCHHCDNRKCVNPNHLFLGTHLDNMLDKTTKGRGRVPHGEDSPHAKLTAKQVIEIINSTEKQCDLALRFGVGKMTISRIKRGQRWGHLHV